MNTRDRRCRIYIDGEPARAAHHETNATERRDAGSKEVCCYETHGRRPPPMNRRRAVSPSQGQRPLVKARETQDLRRGGAHGSTDPPTQSQDGSPRGADTAPEFKKKPQAYQNRPDARPAESDAGIAAATHGLHVLL